MGKKFIFDSDSFNYEVANFSIKSALPRIFITAILGIILGYTLYNNVETIESKTVKHQNEKLLSDFQLLARKIDEQDARMKNCERNDDNVYRSVLGLNSISQATRELGYGGSIKTEKYALQEYQALIDEITHKSLLIKNRIKLQAKSYEEILNLVKNTEAMINSVPAICPLANKDIKRIGSGFGYRFHPVLHVMKLHTGVDISAKTGTPIYASGDGIVFQANSTSGGYGKVVRINHGYNYITVYAHMSKIEVAKGEMVKRGQLIGRVGSTGRSTAPHLHYEVRINNNPVNPLNFFYQDMSDKEYNLMIEQAAASAENFEHL